MVSNQNCLDLSVPPRVRLNHHHHGHHGPGLAVPPAPPPSVPPLRRDNYGRTDLCFLIVFPILFLIFNLFYWISLYWWRWRDDDDFMSGAGGID